MLRSPGRVRALAVGVLLTTLGMVAVWGPRPAVAAQATSSSGSASGPPPPPVSSRRHTAVRIVVPPVTVILVTSSGRPIAVETNTNRAPRKGDMFFVTVSRTAGDLQRATRSQANLVVKTFGASTGWQPGWHHVAARTVMDAAPHRRER